LKTSDNTWNISRSQLLPGKTTTPTFTIAFRFRVI